MGLLAARQAEMAEAVVSWSRLRSRIAMIGLLASGQAGSRWMDAGVSLAEIQRWLGHANISQTSTYLGASIGNDDAAMRIRRADRTRGEAAARRTERRTPSENETQDLAQPESGTIH